MQTTISSLLASFAVVSLIALHSTALTINSSRHSRVETYTVFQLPNVGTWFENLALRRNGDILATRADVGEVWTINPATGAGSLLTKDFGGANACAGIVEIAPDSFAVNCGTLHFTPANISQTNGIPGTFSVFRLDLDRNGRPQVSVLQKIEEAHFLNGLTKFDDDNLLVVDAALGLIYKLNVHSGNYTVALQDSTMAPNPSLGLIGVNGVKVFSDYVYYTSTTPDEVLSGPGRQKCTGRRTVRSRRQRLPSR